MNKIVKQIIFKANLSEKKESKLFLEAKKQI